MNRLTDFRANMNFAPADDTGSEAAFTSGHVGNAELAAEKARKAKEAAEAAEAEAAKAAAEAEKGADLTKAPEPFRAQVQVRGQLKMIDVRNRTYREHFNDMVRRFIGYMGVDGVKIPGEVESGDPAKARYAKDMLSVMAVATGIDNGAIPGDIVPVNPDDVK